MTTNEMIYKTITTKLTKTPTYKSVLEDLGYEVYDSEWSYYNNWTVKNKETGKEVVLSQGYDNKKAIFNRSKRINANNLKKVNYVDLLRKNRPNVSDPFLTNYVYRNFEEGKYADLRRTIQSNKVYIESCKMRIDMYKEELDRISKNIDDAMGRMGKYQKELDAAREKIKAIRKFKKEES